MPDVTISIGGRQFQVSCQEGEEDYLHAAAKMLDDEAQVLSDQVGGYSGLGHRCHGRNGGPRRSAGR